MVNTFSRLSSLQKIARFSLVFYIDSFIDKYPPECNFIRNDASVIFFINCRTMFFESEEIL